MENQVENMGNDECFIFVYGSDPVIDKKYNPHKYDSEPKERVWTEEGFENMDKLINRYPESYPLGSVRG